MADYLSQDQRPASPHCDETAHGLEPKHFTEPTFLIENSPALAPQCPGMENEMADYLAHAVAAAPGNLLRHTQRVFHHYGQNDQDGLYAALLDLFIALGHKGSVLRRRLLNGARNRLRKDCHTRLGRWLNSGCAPAWAELPPIRQSVLSPGITGSLNLVRVSVKPRLERRDPLLEAREYIEYSQLDQARAALEEALSRQPERAELHEELLHLYRATEDLDGFLSTREKLQQVVDSLPAIWDDCERYLRKERTP